MFDSAAAHDYETFVVDDPDDPWAVLQEEEMFVKLLHSGEIHRTMPDQKELACGMEPLDHRNALPVPSRFDGLHGPLYCEHCFTRKERLAVLEAFATRRNDADGFVGINRKKK